jgi:hypothetical protein
VQLRVTAREPEKQGTFPTSTSRQPQDWSRRDQKEVSNQSVDTLFGSPPIGGLGCLIVSIPEQFKTFVLVASRWGLAPEFHPGPKKLFNGQVEDTNGDFLYVRAAEATETVTSTRRLNRVCRVSRPKIPKDSVCIFYLWTTRFRWLARVS